MALGRFWQELFLRDLLSIHPIIPVLSSPTLVPQPLHRSVKQNLHPTYIMLTFVPLHEILSEFCLSLDAKVHFAHIRSKLKLHYINA